MGKRILIFVYKYETALKFSSFVTNCLQQNNVLHKQLTRRYRKESIWHHSEESSKFYKIGFPAAASLSDTEGFERAVKKITKLTYTLKEGTAKRIQSYKFFRQQQQCWITLTVYRKEPSMNQPLRNPTVLPFLTQHSDKDRTSRSCWGSPREFAIAAVLSSVTTAQRPEFQHWPATKRPWFIQTSLG